MANLNAVRWTDVPPLVPASSNRCAPIFYTQTHEDSPAQPRPNFEQPRQIFFSHHMPRRLVHQSGSPPTGSVLLTKSWPGSSRCNPVENQRKSHQPPAAWLTKKTWGTNARTFHQRSPASHQEVTILGHGEEGGLCNVRKPALRFDFGASPEALGSVFSTHLLSQLSQAHNFSSALYSQTLSAMIYFISFIPVACLVVRFYYICGNDDEKRHLMYSLRVNGFSCS